MKSTDYTDFDWAEKKHKAAEWRRWEGSGKIASLAVSIGPINAFCSQRDEGVFALRERVPLRSAIFRSR